MNNTKATVGEFIHGLSDGLYGRERWKEKGHQFYRRQSVLHHTMEALILAKIIIDLEIKHGNPCGINPYRLLSMVLVHDMAELHLDDVILTIKLARPRIRELYKELEFEVFMAMTDQLPEILTDGLIQSFKDSVETSKDVDMRLFDAIEELGYVIDAFEAVLNGKNHYVRVFGNHRESIIAAGKEFVSIRIVFEGYREKIDRFLEKYRSHQLALDLN